MATDGTFTTLYAFSGSDGAYPWAGLLQAADGDLYGTTSSGGVIPGYGTIFRIASDGTSFTTLHTFVNSDGADPLGGLIQGADGYLYGTTSSGERARVTGRFSRSPPTALLYDAAQLRQQRRREPVRRRDPGRRRKPLRNDLIRRGDPWLRDDFQDRHDATSFTTLHRFVDSDGSSPLAGLIQAADGNLYGTTFESGGRLRDDLQDRHRRHRAHDAAQLRQGSDGANPYAGLIQAADGSLYGAAMAVDPTAEESHSSSSPAS